MKRPIIAVLLIIALAACGGDSGPSNADPGDTTTSEDDSPGKHGRNENGNDKPGKGSDDPKDGRNGNREPGDDGDGSGDENGSDPDDAPDGDDPDGGSSDDANVAQGASVVSEPEPDAAKEGTTPQYAEIIEASITGLGETFRMQMTMNGELPDRMPTPNTFMVAVFGIKTKDDDHNFYVSGTSRGWEAYAGEKDDPEEFPGRFEIEGNQIILETNWSEIGGAQRFRWASSATWSSTVAGVSNYSVDPAPNGGKTARYPQ